MEAYRQRVGSIRVFKPQMVSDVETFLNETNVPTGLFTRQYGGNPPESTPTRLMSRSWADILQSIQYGMGVDERGFIARNTRNYYAQLMRAAKRELLDYIRTTPQHQQLPDVPFPMPIGVDEDEMFPGPIPVPQPIGQGVSQRGFMGAGDDLVRGYGLKAVSCSCGCGTCGGSLCGKGYVADLATAMKTMYDLKPILDAAQQEYNELIQYEPEMLEAQGLSDRLRNAITILNTYGHIYNAAFVKYTKTIPKLDKKQLKEYERSIKNELNRLKIPPKPLRPQTPIPEEDETPEMERQNAVEVGKGKRVTFARKYLRGRGIRATKGNVNKVLNAMDVEGVVFES